MGNPWFRLYHEFATDPKVQMLSEINQRRFVMVLCLRCSHDDETLHDETIAFQLRINLREWQKSKAVMIESGLINEKNRPTGWDKRQFLSDTSTKRVAKYRKKKKQQCNVSVTPPDTDTDTDTDTEMNKERGIKSEVQKNEAASISKKIDAVPYKKIVELYHCCLPGLPAVAKLTPKRRAQIRQRFNEDMNDLDKWKNFFDFVDTSDFLMGRVQPQEGRSPFRADIEWLTNSTNFTKIAEEKYHV